jgi:predicted AlkP superfamily pyrophosphatase or phosphodiesterase
MARNVVLLSVPGLRSQDLAHMPHLSKLVENGEQAELAHSFPAVTWPSQATMLTGKQPNEHGVVANGFYWRDSHEVEMWTASNDKILAPQIWDLLHERVPSLTSAAWFPMLSKQSGADYVCMPAPVHNPDGSESLWCYTKPTEFYGELLERLGHFPLKHFWGPLANIKSTDWIAQAAIIGAEKYRPNFNYIYLPHLDYAAQKDGPDSQQALTAVVELDNVIAKLIGGLEAAYGDEDILWLVASEYTVVPVDHVAYPNRLLREAGLLAVREEDGGELIDFANTPAWALVDHQFSHVYIRDAADVALAADAFRDQEGIAEVLVSDQRAKYSIDHERSGEIVLVSSPNSWQAYYYWLDDTHAPGFARTVDIHRKPGYDPVELCFDFATKTVPLDATLIHGSHGAPAHSAEQCGVLLSSDDNVLNTSNVTDTCIAELTINAITS